jgi:hypothetical protein
MESISRNLLKSVSPKKKAWRYPTWYTKAINQRMTDDTMVNRKKTNKQNDPQNSTQKGTDRDTINTVLNSCAPMATPVALLLQARW